MRAQVVCCANLHSYYIYRDTIHTWMTACVMYHVRTFFFEIYVSDGLGGALGVPL